MTSPASMDAAAPLTRTDIARAYREVYGPGQFDQSQEMFARLIERRTAEALAATSPQAAPVVPKIDLPERVMDAVAGEAGFRIPLPYETFYHFCRLLRDEVVARIPSPDAVQAPSDAVSADWTTSDPRLIRPGSEAVHLSHCYQGENPGCKYGYDNCPAADAVQAAPAPTDEVRDALSDVMREVRKINDGALPDGFDARALRNAELVLAAPARPKAGDAVREALAAARAALWAGVLEINKLGGARQAVPLHEAIAAIDATVAHPTEAAPSDQQLIDSAPSPLKNLGQRLGELLDEDQFAQCEALLLEGLLAIQQGRDVQGDIDYYNGNM